MTVVLSSVAVAVFLAHAWAEPLWSFLLLAVLVVLSLILISRQVRDPSGMTYFRRSVITVISPFQVALNTVVGGINGFWNDYLFLVGTNNENELLREEVNRLRSEIQEVREELYRAGRLEEFGIHVEVSLCLVDCLP